MNEDQVMQRLLSIPGIGHRKAQYLTVRLYGFARQAYPYDEKDGITVRKNNLLIAEATRKLPLHPCIS